MEVDGAVLSIQLGSKDDAASQMNEILELVLSMQCKFIQQRSSVGVT